MDKIYIDNKVHTVSGTKAGHANITEVFVNGNSSRHLIPTHWFNNPDGSRMFTGGHWYSSKAHIEFTRMDYLTRECTIWQYYEQFVFPSTRLQVEREIGKTRIVETEDEYLNEIPLGTWDRLGLHSESVHLLEVAGDSYSLAGMNCIHKAAARQIREAWNDEQH